MNKQKGFSLIEITVAMGLLGVVSIGVMKLFENINQGTRTVSKRAAVQDFNNSIKNQVMGKRDVCTANAKSAILGRNIANAKIAGNPNYKTIDFKTGQSPLVVGEVSKSGAHRVESITYLVKDVEPVTLPGAHTSHFNHKGKLMVNYNLQFCKTGSNIEDCQGQNLGRMPSNLPEVEVLMRVSGGSVAEIECQTLDVPLLAESLEYADEIKRQLCKAEVAIVKLTGKARFSEACGEQINVDPGSVVPLYAMADGSLTNELQFDYQDNKCNCCGKKCNCNPPSCPSGYTAINRTKDVTCAWTDVSCCGAKRRMTHTLTCRKAKSPIGHVVSPDFNYETTLGQAPAPSIPSVPAPNFLPEPMGLADEPCGRREIASDSTAPNAPMQFEVEEGC